MGEIIPVDYQLLMFRMHIEESLLNSGKQKVFATLYRLDDCGGQLEFLREIVNDTIQKNIESAYSVGLAFTNLDEGDSHMISGYNKKAWEAFGQVYREVL
jgi:hypothetical protein